MNTFLPAIALGLTVGIQHAFDPDHMAALGTLLPDEPTLKHAIARGGWWGLGHGAAITAIAVPLVWLHLQMPTAIEAAAELAVAIMLITLGGHALWSARRAKPPTARHRAASTTPIGLMHGLAGSGAAVVLATAQSTSTTTAIIFLIVFVLGSTASMATATGVLSLPIRRMSQGQGALVWLRAISGVISIAVGLVWGAISLAS